MIYLNAALRIYVYALHGVAAEVLYTSLWELIFYQNLKLNGHTHAWAFLIYGIFIFVIEKLQKPLQDRLCLPLPVRCLVYAGFIFMWEFSCGFILLQLDACPWDYSPWFHYNVMGLITFEYFPLWYFGSMVVEQFLVNYTLRLCINEAPRPEPKHTSASVTKAASSPPKKKKR